MRKEYDFTQAKRGPVVPVPPGKTRMRIPTKPATHSDMKAATHSEAKAATLPELAASRAQGGSKWPP